MFDLDIGKMIVFGIVALAVIPPKDLPRVMRTVGNYLGKMRRMASDFQGQFMDAMKEVELESVKNELDALNKASRLDTTFDPVSAMRTEMTNAIQPPKPADHAEGTADTSTAGFVSTAVNATPLETTIHEAAVSSPVPGETLVDIEPSALPHSTTEVVSAALSPSHD